MAEERLGLADLAYAELLDAIVEQRLPPLVRLNPERLAKQMGISPTPVKLALTRLTSEGLATLVSRRGFFVTQLNPSELVSLFEARLLLETSAVRDHFDRVTPRFVQQLQEAAREYQRLCENNVDNLSRLLGAASGRFHSLIVGLNGNAFVMRWHEQAIIHLRAYQSRDPGERYQIAISEHSAIVEAFRRGDAAQAENAIRTHIRNATKHYEQLLRQSAMRGPRLRNIRMVGAKGGRPE